MGTIYRRWGDEALLPHHMLRIHAPQGRLTAVKPRMTVTFSGGAPEVTREFEFESPWFRVADVEFDTVGGATRVTSVDTCAHLNRPEKLACERLTVDAVYDRAGVELRRSPNTSLVPLEDAGGDEKWGEQELHDAMYTYWSRYSARSQWALWVLFAGRAVSDLAGVMFDDEGLYQRQGAAVFNDIFNDPVSPPGVPPGHPQRDDPPIVRTSMSTFYTDSSKAVTTTLTRDWLVLENVAGIGDRLVLRGRYTQPDLDTLPRLRATLTDSFDSWYKKDRCSSISKWVCDAALTLTLERSDGTNMTPPIIPVRFAGDPWRVVRDVDNAYQPPDAWVTWSGIPGIVDIALRKPRQTYEGPAVELEALMPKPMRIRFFTNYGVREFPVPPPPPVPILTPTESEADLLKMINNCKQLSTVFDRIKAVQVAWLPKVQPVDAEAQHWQLFVRGLGEGRRLRAWDVGTGELLADVLTRPELTELSIVAVRPKKVPVLQLTLDDTPVMKPATYFRKAAQRARLKAASETPVLIRQTPLSAVDTIELDSPASSLRAERDERRLTVVAYGADGLTLIDIDLLDPHHYHVRTDAPDDAEEFRSSRGRERHPCTRVERGVVVEPTGGPGDAKAPGRYYARPWFDRGDVAGAYFVRLSDDGRAVELFQRGRAHDAWPMLVPGELGDSGS